MSMNGDIVKLPRLTIYKPNKHNTGSVLSLEIHPAYEDRKGYLKLIIAPQVGSGRYDWSSRCESNLSTLDVFSVIPVLKGDTDAKTARIGTRSENGDRFVTEISRDGSGNCIISVSIVSADGEYDCASEVKLLRHEARGIAATIESSLDRIAFG